MCIRDRKETLEAETQSLSQDNLVLQKLAQENEREIGALQQRSEQLLAERSDDYVAKSDPLWTMMIACGGGLVGLLAGLFGARWAREESYRTEPEVESQRNTLEEVLPLES